MSNEATAMQRTPPPQEIASPAQQKQIDALAVMLQQQTPKEVIRWRDGKGGRKLAYVDHAHVTRTLNNAFGWRWSFEVDNELIQYVNELPFEATCRGRLTVWLPGIEVPVTKMQMGCQPIEMMKDKTKPVSIGDAMKGAASDALKKCASLLGIALDLYDSDHDARQNPSEQQIRQQVEQPIETNPNKLAMTLQSPVKSQPRIKLEALMKEVNKTGVEWDKIQYQVERITGKRELAKLTDDECEIVAVEMDAWLQKLNADDVDDLF